MPELETRHFGVVTYREDSVVEFPLGLPAFEEERRFLLIERTATAPVVFLQSLARPELCFITLPARLVEPGYQLAAGPEELRMIGLAEDRQPAIGPEVWCLAIVTLAGNAPPTANLLAPILVNPANRRAVQAIQAETEYSHRHPLPVRSREGGC